MLVGQGILPVEEQVLGHAAVELGVAIDLEELSQHPNAQHSARTRARAAETIGAKEKREVAN